MPTAQTDAIPARKPLRLWPGVVLVGLQWLVRFVGPLLPISDAYIFSVLGALLAGLLVFVWWLFLSRAPWADRLGGLALIVAAVMAAPRLILHESITGGMMGFMFPIYVFPFVCLALVVSAAMGRGRSAGRRFATMAVAIAIACGVWSLVRTGGMMGDAKADFHWRWTMTPEERLLAQANDELPPRPAATPAATPAAPSTPTPAVTAPSTPSPAPTAAPTPTAAPPPAATAAPVAAAPAPAPVVVKTPADWPGFRGPTRDGIVHRGVKIKTDWAASPPVELWRRPIGPGWSSFAAHGDLLYTQEQRGDDEVVAAYKMKTGEPVWRHRDPTRFYESNAGPGPRGTPTLNNGRVYALGATGILNALDAGSGAVVWSRKPPSDTGSKLPGWGFSSSPLIVDDLVVVATAGALVAYDINTGNRRWVGPDGGSGYSSPHLATIGGVPQIILLHGQGASSVGPADGKLLWEFKLPPSARIIQPALVASDILVPEGEGTGMRRLAVAHEASGWTVQERWSTIGLKPYFNDFVVHNGHAYGFDGAILACIDVKDGQRKWKGGRYGHGQLVLLPEQNLLLVLSEEGELVLVSATPDKFTEFGKVPAIEGKTWNHPALVGDTLLVRNGQEMVAFRLSTEDR